MNTCIFCAILDGTAPGTFVYRDGLVSAFMDIQPVNPGHVLVVPNTHAVGLEDLDPDTGERMFKAAQRIAASIRKSGLSCEGINFFLADGEAAFQEVFHAHLHVIPRYRGDGFELSFSPEYAAPPSRKDLESHADAIRERLII